MHQSHRRNRLQPRQAVEGEGEGLGFVEAPAPPFHQRQQVPAPDQLHGHEELAIRLTGIEAGDDVGMVDGRCRLGFTQEAFAEGGIGGVRRQHHLQGDLALQRPLLGSVDGRHATLSQAAEDAIVADTLCWRVAGGRLRRGVGHG